MPFRLEFDIPWTPPSLNKYIRVHWRERGEWLQTVGMYLAAAIGRPQTTWGFRVRATFEVWHPKRRLDDDNVVVGRKLILDALKRLGWIKNDSPRYVESHDLPCRMGSARTKVLIEEIQSGKEKRIERQN